MQYNNWRLDKGFLCLLILKCSENTARFLYYSLHNLTEVRILVNVITVDKGRAVVSKCHRKQTTFNLQYVPHCAQQ